MKRNYQLTLGDLADPEKYCGPLDLDGFDKEIALQFLDKMIEIRLAEETISDWVVDGTAATPCHLGIGQEASAVGVVSQLFSDDRVFGNHRSHSHFLAMGGRLESLFAEVLGRQTGASKGMGGSMHLFDGDIGFQGSVPIVAATISIAVGASLASKMDGGSGIAVCFFGDGAAEEGVLHESLNLAASQNLPVLFVCENNLFSSHLDIDIRQPGNRVARYADAHAVLAESVDGNDVIAVRAATERLVGEMRKSRCPAFIEPITYRHRGHVGPNEDIDVGVHRTMKDVVAWKKRDPIKRLSEALILSGIKDENSIAALQQAVARRVDTAAAASLAAPYPDPDQLTSFVYSGESR